MRPHTLGVSIHYDAQGRVCKCTSDNGFVRKSDFLLAQIAGDVSRVAHLTDETFNTIPFCDFDSETAYARQWKVGPVSKALYDCVADRADSCEFWMLSSDGAQIYVLANSDLLLYNRLLRRIRARESFHSR